MVHCHHSRGSLAPQRRQSRSHSQLGLTTDLLSVPIVLPFSECPRDHTACGLFGGLFLSLRINAFEMHPCCCTCQWLVRLLLNSIIPLCGHLTVKKKKKILSSGSGCLGCFQFLTIMNTAAMNIHKVFCGHIFSFLLVKYRGVELLGVWCVYMKLES